MMTFVLHTKIGPAVKDRRYRISNSVDPWCIRKYGSEKKYACDFEKNKMQIANRKRRRPVNALGTVERKISTIAYDSTDSSRIQLKRVACA